MVFYLVLKWDQQPSGSRDLECSVFGGFLHITLALFIDLRSYDLECLVFRASLHIASASSIDLLITHPHNTSSIFLERNIGV